MGRAQKSKKLSPDMTLNDDTNSGNNYYVLCGWSLFASFLSMKKHGLPSFRGHSFELKGHRPLGQALVGPRLWHRMEEADQVGEQFNYLYEKCNSSMVAWEYRVDYSFLISFVSYFRRRSARLDLGIAIEPLSQSSLPVLKQANTLVFQTLQSLFSYSHFSIIGVRFQVRQIDRCGKESQGCSHLCALQIEDGILQNSSLLKKFSVEDVFLIATRRILQLPKERICYEGLDVLDVGNEA
ncbi:hypothetical protein VNO77_16451 [Canavalia gladiata]|uniref:Uncharacterized protein n=1 Tax=Canavalia gladiata TaxID=3824 RepID=A0AAN9M175_CANGL